MIIPWLRASAAAGRSPSPQLAVVQ
eukprot:COSAG02_NODE_27343_length_612_cov_0.384016_1_plen_24_part_01